MAGTGLPAFTMVHPDAHWVLVDRVELKAGSALADLYVHSPVEDSKGKKDPTPPHDAGDVCGTHGHGRSSTALWAKSWSAVLTPVKELVKFGPRSISAS